MLDHPSSSSHRAASRRKEMAPDPATAKFSFNTFDSTCAARNSATALESRGASPGAPEKRPWLVKYSSSSSDGNSH